MSIGLALGTQLGRNGPVKPNPLLFLAPLNGSLAFQDKAGGGTLTGSGAVRYLPSQGARVNLIPNPSAEVDTSGWSSSGVTLVRATDWSSSGSASFKMTATAVGPSTGAFTTTSGLGMIPVVGGMQYTYSVTIYNPNASARSVRPNLVFRDRVSATTTSSPSGFVTLAPGDTTRLSVTATAGATHDACYVVTYLDNSGTSPFVNGDMLYFDGAMVEQASSAGTYFDGSTGGSWINPTTGMLGTSHSSPSTTRAAAWVEEATTNVVVDPIFGNATITNGWSVNGTTTTIARDTNTTVFGQASGKVTAVAGTSEGMSQVSTLGGAAATGQTWTASAYVRANTAAEVGKTVTLLISERDSVGALVKDNTSGTFALTAIWQRITYTVALSGGATTAAVIVKIQNGSGAVAVTFNVDGVQLEQKGYATSLCAGSIGTGYAWTGTAHASSSTRTAATLTATNAGRATGATGAMAGRLARLVDTGTPQRLLDLGGSGAAGVDRLLLQIGSSDVAQLFAQSNAAASTTINDTGNALAVGAATLLYGEWTPTACALGVDGGAFKTGSRTGVQDTFGAGLISIGQTSAASYADGLVGPVLIADRPLTAAERAALAAAPAWGWTVLQAV